VQENARKGDALLLPERQGLIPALPTVQSVYELAKATSLQGGCHGCGVERVRGGGIRHCRPQAAQRQVWPLRQKHHLLGSRDPDHATAPGPETTNGPKERALARAGHPLDQHPLAGADLRCRILDQNAAVAQGNGQPLKGQPPIRVGPDLNALVVRDRLVQIQRRLPETRDPQHRRAPVGDLREVVDEVSQRRLHLIERAHHHHHHLAKTIACR
jgi:hypothetical protein